MSHFRPRPHLTAALRYLMVTAIAMATIFSPGMATAAPAAAGRPMAAGISASADTTPPVSYSDVLSSYDGEAVINLYVTDDDSGVAHTYYKLDNGPQQEGTLITVGTRGQHTLEFWSVDVAGNVETPHVFAPFYVNIYEPDHTAPVTTCDAKASYIGQAMITFSASDEEGGSGVAHTWYVLDNAAPADGLSCWTNVIGSHTVQYASEDHDGNREATKTASFSVLPNKTTITLRTSATSARIGGVPILSGIVTPVETVGKLMVVYVMKPGTARWTYSSNRVIYRLGANAAWQYKYYFKSGMRKGVYKYKAVFPASAPYPTCQSPNTVSITLR